jgi:hypothetical protein
MEEPAGPVLSIREGPVTQRGPRLYVRAGRYRVAAAAIIRSYNGNIGWMLEPVLVWLFR